MNPRPDEAVAAMTRQPDPRPPGTRLHAVTPSLGVRLWLERGPVVCLHAGNEGGTV